MRLPCETIATMSSTNPEIRQLERAISHLLNKQLQQICQSSGLRTSGVKADLQTRIKKGEWVNIRDGKDEKTIFPRLHCHMLGERERERAQPDFCRRCIRLVPRATGNLTRLDHIKFTTSPTHPFLPNYYSLSSNYANKRCDQSTLLTLTYSTLS